MKTEQCLVRVVAAFLRQAQQAVWIGGRILMVPTRRSEWAVSQNGRLLDEAAFEPTEVGRIPAPRRIIEGVAR